MKMKPYPLYNVPDIKNIRELVEYSGKKFSKNRAYTYFKGDKLRKHTYEEMLNDVRGLATSFLENGYKDGTKIAVVGKNSYLWAITFLATQASGNVIVPLDKELPEKTMKEQMNDSGTKAIVYDEEFSEYFDNYKGAKPICMRGELSRLITHGQDLYQQDSSLYDSIEIDDKETSVIIYTSGTTGQPKGVCLSQNSIMTCVVNAHKLLKIKGDTVCVLPLHHTYPMSASFIAPLIFGFNCHMNASLKDVSKDIMAAQPFYICVVPLFAESFYKKIWEGIKASGKEELVESLIKTTKSLLKIKIDMRKRLFKSILDKFGGELEIIVSGGAPMPEYIYGLQDFGLNIIEGYGITECSPFVSGNRVGYYKKRSVGIVLPTCEAKIFDENENGEGEICIRGGVVMNGYYNNKKATDEVLIDGWFSTGDIGYIDEDGFIFITGRKKNLIITSTGKNIHPEELEELAGAIEGVLEIVVTGDKKRIYAEIFIDPDKPNVKEEDIEKAIKELNKTLPNYKRINEVTFRKKEFEKTTTKKIKRW